MRVHFNAYERAAGAFVTVAILASAFSMIGVAVKNGWFLRKVQFTTELESADGVHAGTVVQIAGLRVGQVSEVELGENNHVRVKLEVLEKFSRKIRVDSQIEMYRPFVLSDKVLEIRPGDDTAAELELGANIPTVASTDIMDLLSGKKMTAALSSFDHLAESLRVVGLAFSNRDRTKALVQMLDQLNPLANNLNTMAVEVVKLTNVANREKRAETIVSNLSLLSQQLGQMLPAFNGEAPNVGQQLGQIVNNLNVLTTELKKLTPAVSVLAPELPRTSRRAVEALDETVVLLKALQKSFLFKSSVREVHEEESRKPANTSEP